MLTITLRQEGKYKIYSVPFISGRVLRASYPAQKLVDGLASNEQQEDAATMDALAGFICLAFGDQFTLDELYDGYCADHLVSTAFAIITAIRTGTTEALGNFPNEVDQPHPTPGTEA